MMVHIQQDTSLLLLLKYFSIFKHPLTFEELHLFSSENESREALQHYLQEQLSAGVIEHAKGYYFFKGEDNIAKREAGAAAAAQLLPKAKKAGRFIARFPFVKFVGISGSLSKGYADAHTDFDFFIVTAPNALWICRTLLHLFKKLSFLVSRQHWFCMNYFIDEHHIKIEEQNIFTQIELSTLIPVYNKDLYRLLLLKNKDNLPNFGHLPASLYPSGGLHKLEQEYDLPKNKWLIPFNLFFMKLTDEKWKKKWKKKGYPMEDYPLAFKTTPYVSKNHPKNYQKKILNQLKKDQL